MLRILYLSVLFLTVASVPLFAYLDPGTGSYIIQLFIAVIAGAALGLKIFWQNVKTFFAGIFGKKKKR